MKTCREALKLAEDAEDESSAALVSDRMVIHEKTAWMLRMMGCRIGQGYHFGRPRTGAEMSHWFEEQGGKSQPLAELS